MLLVICGFSNLLAQTESDTLKAVRLEEVSINSIRALPDEPVTTTTVSQKTIQQNFRGQDAAFLLERLTPAIVTYSESGTSLSNYGQMRLRGIDQTRINITLNGVPLNDMIDQGVFFSNIIDFGGSLQSVQVQRGVGTSTNGVASYAGSVNFESPSLTNSEGYSNLQLTAGSFNSLKASAEVSTGLLENRTSFYARISHLQSDGYRYHTGTVANSMFFSGGYFGDKHSLKFTGVAGRSQNDLAYYPVDIADIRTDPRTNYVSENDIDDFGQWLTQLQHTWRLADERFLSTTLYYGGAGGDFPAGFYDSTGFVQINYPLYNQHLGVISNLNLSNQARDSRINVGVHAYTFQRTNIEYVIPNRVDPYYEDRSQKDEVSAFGKWNRRFGRWQMLADVQLRWVSLSFYPDETYLGESAIVPAREYFFMNPKAGVSYDLNPDWQLYLSFGRSGREPTRYDVLGSTQINTTNLPIVQNPDAVDPEFVNDLELGVRWSGDRIRMQANAFYMDFENEIAPIGVYIPEAFVQIYRNQESSYRTGLELEMEWQVFSKLTLSSQSALMKARISSYQPENQNVIYEDVTPILSPELNLRFGLEYYILKNLTFGGDYRYLSSSFIELTNRPQLTVPASSVVNLNLRWQFWKEHELAVQLNNLTDALYYTYGAPGSSGLEPAYFVQPPRHVYFILNLRF